MIVLGCFDAAWGLGTVALGEQLQIIAGQLDDNRIGMALGRVVHFVTFGVLTVSGVETGEHAKELLAMLPRPGYLVEVGWVRVGLSAAAVISGVLLSCRQPLAIRLVFVWSLIALAWTVWSTVRTWSLTVNHLGDSDNGENIPMFAIEIAIHFVWPIVLAWRCGMAIAVRWRRAG